VADDTVKEFLRKIGRKGGKARLKKHGVEALRVMGSKGGKARAKKYDSKTLSKWARKSWPARRAGKEGQ
jgi:general stress protein YciG